MIFDLMFAIKQMPVSFDNDNKSYKLTSILQVIKEIIRNSNSKQNKTRTIMTSDRKDISENETSCVCQLDVHV